MKTGIFYFSGTGNTRWVAEKLHTCLEHLNVPVSAASIESTERICLKGFQRIILAHPIYGASVPGILRDFFLRHSVPPDIPLIIVTTFGYVNACGVFTEQKLLKRKIFSYYNVKMFNNISTPAIKGSIVSREARISRKHEIEERIGNIAGSIAMNKRVIQGIRPYLLGGIIVRKAISRKMHDNYLTLSVDHEKCILCDRCIANCPTESISRKNGTFAFASSCTACMRCYNSCPAFAVIKDGIYADPEKYPRYQGPWK